MWKTHSVQTTFNETVFIHNTRNKQKNCCRVKKYLQGLIVNGKQLDKAGRREKRKVDYAL